MRGQKCVHDFQIKTSLQPYLTYAKVHKMNVQIFDTFFFQYIRSLLSHGHGNENVHFNIILLIVHGKLDTFHQYIYSFIIYFLEM